MQLTETFAEVDYNQGHPGLQDRILPNCTTGLPTCLHQKKLNLVPKEPEKAR